MLQQPPVSEKQPPADKTTQPPAEKTPQKPPAKNDKELTGIDKPGEVAGKKDQQPVETLPAPEVPVQLPPGAKIAVPGPAAPAPGNFKIGSILEPALWLIGILTFGAILIAWLKKNKERQRDGFSVSPHEQLTAFRDSMEEGDMTEEEFKKVKAHLAAKIRPPAAPAPAPAAPTTPEKQVAPPPQNGTTS
jgi:hypothetical protein